MIDASEESLTSHEDRAIYMSDDRMDVYAHPDAILRERAMYSTPTMMVKSFLPTLVELTDSVRLGEKWNLCATERFWGDPVLAQCSSVLIDDDLVLTAGHCLTSTSGCQGYAFVFNYLRPADGEYEDISGADFFTCSDVVIKVNTSKKDFAVVRLNRPATPRFTPAPVAFGRHAFRYGHPAALIGNPSGVPLKIAAGGEVRHGLSENKIRTTLDVMPGNSGSAVYSMEGYTVAGVVSASNLDSYVDSGGCNVVNQSPLAISEFYAMPAILDELCAVPGFVSERLCDPVRGYVVSVSPSGVVRGGAFDRRDLSLGVEVQMLFTSGSIPFHTSVATVANLPREEVNRQYGVLGQHGFRVKVPQSLRNGNAYMLRVFVRDAQSNASKQIFEQDDVRFSSGETGSDFDGDGHADLVRYDASTGQVETRYGTSVMGPFHFTAASQGSWAPNLKLVPGDFNGDGYTDLVRYDASTGQVETRYGVSDVGPFHFTAASQSTWAPNLKLVPGDFNGDGYTDLVRYDASTGQVETRYGTAAMGPFHYVAASQSTWAPNLKLVPGDFNGDGYTDLVRYDASTGQVETRYGTAAMGPFHYVAASQSTWAPNLKLVPGDFNGDGYTDLVRYDASTGQLETRYGTAAMGPFHFTAAFQDVWLPNLKLVPGDFNGDGYTDLVRYDASTGQLETRYGTAAMGPFHFTTASQDVWLPNLKLVPGDFNGDGYTDLVRYDGSTGQVETRYGTAAMGPFYFIAESQNLWGPGLELIGSYLPET